MSRPEMLALHNIEPEFFGYQRKFVDYLRDPVETEALAAILPARISVYAKLMYNKIEGSLDACFPVCRELLESDRWQQLVKLFIKEHCCESPLYRDIPDEFINYLLNETPDMALPAFFSELAHFEWMELVLETAQNNPIAAKPAASDLLATIPVLNPVMHLLHYHYPVQTIMPSDENWTYWKEWETVNYKEESAHLIGLRDEQYGVHFIETNPATLRLIELLQDNFRTGEQAATQLALELRHSDHVQFLTFCRDILNNLKQQQIIVGTVHE
ncbi:hypothetical protein MGMO_177c00070 [Methyloglobulus morosus KoM1]|uniref:Uncharacterized protein n=1 Tax=Methyloglobulus morosus KoM1 TaxID=1116472 RepID=V5DH24_9GAMM|nr:DUF2063 domain-containing protein [Methyloglobulus morosus]ESS66716.1 hypothetical protein MGMO_177c00070 [Methyloglobulus morosus KoM1]